MEIKVCLDSLYFKEEAGKGKIERFNYDYARVANDKVEYVKNYGPLTADQTDTKVLMKKN